MDLRTRIVENVLSRSLSMVFTVIAFSSYTLGNKGYTADWLQIAITLFFFGIAYEILTFLFQVLFRYITSLKNTDGEVVTVHPHEPTTHTKS